MRLRVGTQAIWWGGAALLLFVMLWLLGNTIAPFLVGAGIAYVLDPLASRLVRLGLSRPLAVGVITLLAVMGIGAGLVLLVPALIRQAAELFQASPDYFKVAQEWFSGQFSGLLPDGLPGGAFLSERGSRVAQQLSEVAGKALPTLLESVSNLIGVLVIVVVAPVVAFYLLLDWQKMIEDIDGLLPRDHADTIRDLAQQMNVSLSGFLRGQGLVTLILGTFYAISLVAVGLPYGLVIGILAAVLSIIPYVGVFIGGVTAIGIAIIHFWGEPVWIGAVMAIFAFGQAVEGNVLQPRIVGDSVGLHPVWLMLALAVFGTLFGFAGLVMAVPLAAVIGVLVRFAVEHYRKSGLYTGRQVPRDPPPPMLVELVPRGTTARLRVSASIDRNETMARIRDEEDGPHEAEAKDAAAAAVDATTSAAKNTGARARRDAAQHVKAHKGRRQADDG